LAGPNIVSLIQQSGYTKLTLPIGSFVPYNLQEGNAYPEYNFRYGGIGGDEPNLLQVWAGSSAFPKQLSVTKGTTQTVYAIEVIVSEIHPDYIMILVKRLT
jgi:hypothetical protein